MTSGNVNYGSRSLTVGDIFVEELLDFDPGVPQGAEIQTAFAGGARAIGHLFTTKANSRQASFGVAYPSSDSVELDALCLEKTTIQVTFSLDDSEDIPDGAVIGFASANCKLTMGGGGHPGSESPEPGSYTLNCIGYTVTYKGGRTLGVDENGNVVNSSAATA